MDDNLINSQHNTDLIMSNDINKPNVQSYGRSEISLSDR